MKRSVIFFDDSECGVLLLSCITRKDNQIQKAIVVNSHWYFEIEGNKALAKDGNGKVVTEFSFKTIREVVVPDDKKGDYNEIISWAEQEIRN
jgi:hypothetical protein